MSTVPYLIIVVYMSPYLVLLVSDFFPARFATPAHGLDSNVTQLLANLLTKSSVFYYLPIFILKFCFNKIIIITIIIAIIIMGVPWTKGIPRNLPKH